MGKSKGGGGSSSPHIGIPPALNSSGGASLLENVFNPIGTYGSNLFGPLSSLANWAANIATGGNVLGGGMSLPVNGLLAGGAGQIFSPFTAAAGAGGSANVGGAAGSGSGINPFNGGSQNSLLGPFLSQFQQGISGMEAGTITGEQQLGNDTNLTNWLTSQGQKELKQATTGSGLFPSQQAMINQSVQSQQAAIQQQLSSEGLGSSTVNAQLQGQAKMSGAAAAGQLVQGNIQAAQNTLSLAQEGQKIDLAAQEALYTQFQGISQLSSAEQAQMWSEAQQGYGTLGQMMNTTLGAFGYSMKTQEDVLQSNETSAQIQAGIQSQQAQMAQQGATSMFGALGSLLGGSSSGGGLLGGLLGTAGASGGGLASIGGAIGGGASGLISGIGSALGALFCEVARTVYGVDSPDWLLFRDWILFRAPKPVRTAYVVHAFRVSRWIKGRPIICKLIRSLMNAVLYADSLMP